MVDEKVNEEDNENLFVDEDTDSDSDTTEDTDVNEEPTPVEDTYTDEEPVEEEEYEAEPVEDEQPIVDDDVTPVEAPVVEAPEDVPSQDVDLDTPANTGEYEVPEDADDYVADVPEEPITASTPDYDPTPIPDEPVGWSVDDVWVTTDDGEKDTIANWQFKNRAVAVVLVSNEDEDILFDFDDAGAGPALIVVYTNGR